MRVDPCSFCSRPVYPSKGITFCRNDGRAFRFCRSKCHANFKMKRNPRKLTWTKSGRLAHPKPLGLEPHLTLGMAARRNVPVRYNREHLSKTVTAMNRIAEIRDKRERALYKKRFAQNRRIQKELDRKLVEEHSDLLPRERGSVRVEREAREEEDLVDTLEQGLEGLGERIDKVEAKTLNAFGSRAERKEYHRLRLLTGNRGVEMEMDGDEDG